MSVSIAVTLLVQSTPLGVRCIPCDHCFQSSHNFLYKLFSYFCICLYWPSVGVAMFRVSHMSFSQYLQPSSFISQGRFYSDIDRSLNEIISMWVYREIHVCWKTINYNLTVCVCDFYRDNVTSTLHIAINCRCSVMWRMVYSGENTVCVYGRTINISPP